MQCKETRVLVGRKFWLSASSKVETFVLRLKKQELTMQKHRERDFWTEPSVHAKAQGWYSIVCSQDNRRLQWLELQGSTWGGHARWDQRWIGRANVGFCGLWFILGLDFISSIEASVLLLFIAYLKITNTSIYLIANVASVLWLQQYFKWTNPHRSVDLSENLFFSPHHLQATRGTCGSCQ